MIPVIDSLLRQCGYAENEAVRQAIDEACHNQTSFVDAVLDVPGVNERTFLQGLSTLLDLPWWEPDPDKQQDRSLRRYLPADVALKNRLLPISIDTKPSENAANAIDQASAVEATALHIAATDPLNLVARQQLAAADPVFPHAGCQSVWDVAGRASYHKPAHSHVEWRAVVSGAGTTDPPALAEFYAGGLLGLGIALALAV